MSVLVFAESFKGEYKKQSFEAISFAKQIANKLNTTVTAVSFGVSEAQATVLGKYGANKIIIADNNELQSFDSGYYAKALAQIADQEKATIIIASNTPNGCAFAPRVAARLNAGIVSGVNAIPTDELTAQKAVFSGKSLATYTFESEKKVLTLQPNTIQLIEFNETPTIKTTTVDLSGIRAVQITAQETQTDSIPLAEAEIVVSGGRGLNAPENFAMIEELAELLGGAVACSRAVSDEGWRPHSEHVGQTGLTIRPNLYIAIGISGAIQHLAGINQSKIIVAINKDPDAPIFKTADYGIIGDAFEIVPQLINDIKNQT